MVRPADWVWFWPFWSSCFCWEGFELTRRAGYRLAVELHGQLPGIDRAQVQRIMGEAHKTCPYSKGLRGDTFVKVVAD